MSFFLLLLLLIFIVFILMPVIRVAWTVHKMRSDARKVFGRMNGASDGPESTAGDPFAEFFTNMAREQTRKKRARGKRKKIAPDVGEYVEFQEIATKTKYIDEEVDFIPEEQISDAEWEDLPGK